MPSNRWGRPSRPGSRVDSLFCDAVAGALLRYCWRPGDEQRREKTMVKPRGLRIYAHMTWRLILGPGLFLWVRTTLSYDTEHHKCEFLWRGRAQNGSVLASDPRGRIVGEAMLQCSRV